MRTPVIRRLVPSDATEYRALMLEAYATAPDAFTSSVSEREQLPLTWWEARVADTPSPGERVWGTFFEQQLVGVAGLAMQRRERTAHKCTLFGMYVRPSARRTGVARHLVDAALSHASGTPGLEVVQLTVTESNERAVRLYTACGFVPFGSEPFAVKLEDRFLTKLHMWRRVEPPTP